MYRLARNARKNESKKTRVSFLRLTSTRVLVVLRSVIHGLHELLNFGLSRAMVTLEWIEFGCVY